MLVPGDRIELAVEKPAGGGRMIARHGGQVVLVRGAIPDERVRAVVERVDRRLAFASTLEVLAPSPDRRDAATDPRCGGALYSHISYPRQLAIKGDVIGDAFSRLGRIPLGGAVQVAGSPERAYRMRARFHVRDGRAGFFREGTHDLCDAASTGQLTEAAAASAAAVVELLTTAGAAPRELELTENLAGDSRAIAVDLGAGAMPPRAEVDSLAHDAGLAGCVLRSGVGKPLVAGTPFVADPLSVLTRGRASAGELTRHAESFFQGNRFLISDLVSAVLGAVAESENVLDLYAGVGLFSVSLAATGRAAITAVEGDRRSGADLQRNAGAFGDAIRIVLGSVEDYVSARRGRPPSTVIVDPPRTGISKEAMAPLLRLGTPRIVYVSCDPATMARDARRLLDGGYRLEALTGFDLFPNTAHVELLGVFTR